MREAVRVHATVRGRVQMVGFRAFVLRRAAELGLRGTVANRGDGSVECVVEGPKDAVDTLIQFLRQGPRSARVEAVEVVEQPFRGDMPSMTVTA
ncbi:MAG: acylphosphatase [Candidatus Dormiibacterota bacterium]